MRIAIVLALAVLVACGSRETASPSQTPPPPPLPDPTPPAPARAQVELHEWGLVDVDPAGRGDVRAGPFARVPMVSRKPVLYAHLLGDGPVTLAVGVRLPAGTFVEHWPPAQVTGSSLSWADIRVRQGACPTAAEPARDLARACDAPDGVCEVDELERYATEDHDCMSVGGADTGLLFYRARLASAELPLRVVRNADLSLSVSATRSTAGAPGAMLRLSTALSGPWPPGRVVISRARAPGQGQTLSMAVGTEIVDAAAERERLGQDLATLGMTTSEARAFLEAWADELFTEGATRGPSRERRMPAPTPQDVLLYWLPPDAVDATSVVATEPRATLKRAFLVRVNLGAVSTAAPSPP